MRVPYDDMTHYMENFTAILLTDHDNISHKNPQYTQFLAILNFNWSKLSGDPSPLANAIVSRGHSLGPSVNFLGASPSS